MISKTNNRLPLVILEGLKHGNRFYTYNSNPNEDPTKVNTGEVAYKVLAFCDTGDEARTVIDAADAQDPTGKSQMDRFIEEHNDSFKALGIDVEFVNRFIRNADAEEKLERLSRISPITLHNARNIVQE